MTVTRAENPVRASVRTGSRRASAFLARRSLTSHRRAWTAVFAATAAAAALLGAFALVLGSLLLALPPVERYTGADAVVVADQRVTYTAKPWGSEPQTATAHLPERVRLERSVLARAAAADGVARAVADDSVPVTVGKGASAVGRSWPSAALTPYELSEGRAPRSASEVVVDAALASPGRRVTLQVGGAARQYTVSGLPRPVTGAAHPPCSSPSTGSRHWQGIPARWTRSASWPSGVCPPTRCGPRWTGPWRGWAAASAGRAC